MAGVQKLKKSNYKGNKSRFSFESQLKIIEEAKLTKNNTQVGRKYGISETCVRSWRKKEAEIRKKIFMKPDDENDVVDLNENTGKKLPEKETKTQKTTLKILMKADDSQTAVKEIILENSGDVSIGETIDQNNTYDESPSKDTVCSGDLRLSPDSTEEFNKTKGNFEIIQPSSSSSEEEEEITPKKTFDKKSTKNQSMLGKKIKRNDEDYIPPKFIAQRFSPLGQARFRVRQKQLRTSLRILSRPLPILDEEKLTGSHLLCGLEKINDIHPNFIDSGMKVEEENEKEFQESILDSSKNISTPSFEIVENSTTKLYERLWKEKQKSSQNTSGGLFDDNGIEDTGKENIITTSDDTDEHIEVPLEKRTITVKEEHPEPTYILDFALDSDIDDNGKVICWICPLIFSNLSDAESHFKEKHTGLKRPKPSAQ